MSPGDAIIALSELLFILLSSNLETVYQATDCGLFWMVDDEECRLSFFSIQFLAVRECYYMLFYNFIYLYMPLYQFHTFSAACMLESKPACRYCEVRQSPIFDRRRYF